MIDHASSVLPHLTSSTGALEQPQCASGRSTHKHLPQSSSHNGSVHCMHCVRCSTASPLQGNCSTPLPTAESLGLIGAPLLPSSPGQCLLTFTQDLLSTSATGSHQLWLDSLYLRDGRTLVDTAAISALSVVRPAASAPAGGPELWVTRCTVQGDGTNMLLGVRTSSKVYAEGVAAELAVWLLVQSQAPRTAACLL